MDKKEKSLIWSAGFFDGEGCTHFGKAGIYSQLVIRITQHHDPVTLYYFQEAVGCGVVNGPYQRTRKNGKEETPHWQFAITSGHEVIETITKLWPYLQAPKRNQALLAIQAWEEYRTTMNSVLNPDYRTGRVWKQSSKTIKADLSDLPE